MSFTLLLSKHFTAFRSPIKSHICFYFIIQIGDDLCKNHYLALHEIKGREGKLLLEECRDISSVTLINTKAILTNFALKKRS